MTTRVIVDVTLKPEILDPQGQAILAALPALGLELGTGGVTAVRQGKHFVVDLDGDLDAARLATVRELARRLLSNPVIEDFALRVDDDQPR